MNKIEGRFKPTMLGTMLVEKLLQPGFDDILDVEYTRELEEELDKIEEGKTDYKSDARELLQEVREGPEARRQGDAQPQGGRRARPPVACDKCGKPMVIKAGKFGLFLACSGYPECENTRELETPEAGAEGEGIEESVRELRQADGDEARPLRPVPRLHRLSGVQDDAEDHRDQAGHDGGQAGSDPRREVPEVRVEPGRQAGPLRRVHGLHATIPTCKYVKQKSTGVICPKDGGDIVERKSRRGKVFYGCANYPDCDFMLWNRPVLEKCPECGAPFLVEKITKRHGRQLICNNEECCYVRSEELRAG